MSVRLRRLQADFERIQAVFSKCDRLRIHKTVGAPPEKYLIEYLVRGLAPDAQGHPVLKTGFLVEVSLTQGYPRQAPQCRMLVPVFHPNIAPHALCIGDHWAAGESLANLLVRIAEMLSYQSYNVKSPLNGEAARWVEANKVRVPTDPFDFATLLSEEQGGASAGAAEPRAECPSCGKLRPVPEMKTCASRHAVCAECARACFACGAVLCAKCETRTCAHCKGRICGGCATACPGCRITVCPEHTRACAHCAARGCADCVIACAACERGACLDHIRKDPRRGYVCAGCAGGTP